MPDVFENFSVFSRIAGSAQFGSTGYPQEDVTMFHNDFNAGGNAHTFSPYSNSNDSQGLTSASSPMSVSSSPQHNSNYITLENATIMEKPYIQILEQPVEKFRFRYKSEMLGTHGSLIGASSATSRKKRSPTVKLVNHIGKAVVRCTLVTSDEDRRSPHAHRLVRREDNGEKDDPHELEVGPDNNFLAVFRGMGIIHTAKKNIKDELIRKLTLEREEEVRRNNINTVLSAREVTQIKMEAESAQKWMNLNSVALCFQAFVVNENVRIPITDRVYSKPINNLKSALTGELRICRIDKISGSCEGNEDVFIFVEKVGKKNIKIKFFELNSNGQEIWVGYGRFNELDVHHQYAIAFKTPPYKDMNITCQKEVYIQLERPTDGDISEPVRFIYTPTEKMVNESRKRARISYSGSCDQITSTTTNINTNTNIIEDAFKNAMDQESNGNVDSHVFSAEIDKMIAEGTCNSDDMRKYLQSLNDSGEFPKYINMVSDLETNFDTDGPTSKMELEERFFAKTMLLKAKEILEKQPTKARVLLPRLMQERTAYGDTALHAAIRLGQINIAKYILLLLSGDPAYRSLVNVQNSFGKSPLHYAVLQNQPQITKALLMIGADPNACDDQGFSPLHVAAKIPDAGLCVDALLSEKSTNLESHNDAGRTPIHLAAECGSLHALRSLVKAGVNVNITDMTYGRTALHIAVEGGHTDIVQYLLKETNIDVNMRNFSGNTALHSVSVSTGQRAKELCQLLMQHNADPAIENHIRDTEDDVLGIKRELESDDEAERGSGGQSSFDLASDNPEILQLLAGEIDAASEGLVATVETKQEIIEPSDTDDPESTWLDESHKLNLAILLDKSAGWEKLADQLGANYFDTLPLREFSNPSLPILNLMDVKRDVPVRKLHELLERIGEKEAADYVAAILADEQ